MKNKDCISNYIKIKIKQDCISCHISYPDRWKSSNSISYLELTSTDVAKHECLVFIVMSFLKIEYALSNP